LQWQGNGDINGNMTVVAMTTVMVMVAMTMVIIMAIVMADNGHSDSNHLWQ
jgi:hypothetical protein